MPDPLIATGPIRIVPTSMRPALLPTHGARGAALLLVVLVVLTGLVGGCDGLNSRRAAKRGNEAFKAGEYEKAIEEFNTSLKLEPNLAVAHHNLGLAYFKLSSGKSDPDEIRKFSDLAAEHLGEYLKANPKDSIIRNKMTQIWVDSDNFEKALAYWAEQLQAQPGNQEVMSVLSGINLKAGRWEASLDWLQKSIDVAPSEENRRSLYVQMGRRCRQVITNREKIVGQERMKVSNVCIPAMLKGLDGEPKNTELRGMINLVMGIRALSQGASFANAIDKATGQDHDQLRRVYVEEAKKAQAALNPPTAEAPSTTPPATGSASGSASGSAGSATSGASGSGSSAAGSAGSGAGSASGATGSGT